MSRICDLHTHSTYSDGTFTPTEIVESAVACGLSAVALTDHNTIDGLSGFMSAGEGCKIDKIPGIEFSVDFSGREIHLLGLFVKSEYYSQVTSLMSDVNRWKEESNIALISSLSRAGIPIDYETIKKSNPQGMVNRAYIGAALTRMGYTKSIPHAFETLMSPSSGHYKEPKRLNVWDVIDFVTSIHAVPVLAHPFLNLNEFELSEFLPEAKSRGLLGMECIYSTYDTETTEKSLKIAEEFGVLPSGGSDFHGENKTDIMLGKGRGNLAVPYEYYENLYGLVL